MKHYSTYKLFSSILLSFVAFVQLNAQVAKIGSTSYNTLEDALNAAVSGNTVVLTKDYTLNKAVTVKSGVTLLIPYDDSNNELLTTPLVLTEGEWKNLKRYRTLTMGANANITVYGDICVGGQIYSTSNKMNKDMGGPGTPTGNYGCIDMKSGGKITLESGSILYAWGFITGQNKDEGNNTTGVGTIEAKSGSTVYEDFVIGDWHGGGQTLSWYIRNRSYFFPFNQYFVPNIEVPLILDYGAKENTYSNIYVSKNKIDLPINNFITKDNGLFNIKTSGSYIKKWYDSTTDEQSFEFAGDVSIGSLSFKYSFAGIDSKDCVLPF